MIYSYFTIVGFVIAAIMEFLCAVRGKETMRDNKVAKVADYIALAFLFIGVILYLTRYE